MAGNTVPAIIDISMAPALIKEMEPPVEPPPSPILPPFVLFSPTNW